MRVFLTGGAGFIGSHICEALLNERDDLIVFDHFNRNSLKYIEGWEKITTFRGDVTDYDLLKATIRAYRPEVIINLASMAGIETVEKKPLSCIETNLLGPYYLCKLALENDVDKLIHFSSSEVYGPRADGSTEDSFTSVGAAGDARWSYGATKAAADHMVHAFIKQGLQAIVVRPFNIFGERQTGHGAIAHFIVWALQNKNITIYGDGSSLRAWCYVKNLVEAILKMLDLDVTGTYNIGDPRSPIKVQELAELICKLAGSNSKLVHVPPRPVDVEYRVPNIDKAQKNLNWKPTWTFEEGIKRAIEWYKTIEIGKETWRSAIG